MDERISIRLKRLLSDAKWTQEQLARRLDVSQKTLNLWISEKSAPRAKNIEAINSLYQDIVGRAEVDAALLAAAEKKALAKRITVKEIITNEELLDKLTLHLTYHTNTIEGSTMTLAEVKEVLDDDNKVLANKTAKEQIEARNHRTALYYLLDELNAQGKKFKWSKDLILDTHLRLMNTLISNAGMFRRHGVRIMGSRTSLANYLSVPQKIDEFIEAINRPVRNLIERLARTHAVFEQIHPFSDGNGRTGRLILFIQALQHSVAPPLVVKERKRAYYKYLEIAHLQDKYELLRLFMAESIILADNLIKI
ncbi:MAG: Fic family protein [Candidatus Margulisbacteria bacterium]|jgi:Fic family protein/DNA-binding XRE family transcriptional regulator|nr:Fic family protein [Candidatus Margulisiibacteriota bacterium]